ncbi:hypothetical protein D5b_00290 [Faustovirus]|nr:hypothetical protein D5b_00290 [Faustovirus]AMN84622.1 hypothetical protein D6_00219 [Faustovirus]
MSKHWQFVYCVSEGAPGFCDSDQYESEWFDSFEKCYRKYLDFDPRKHWSHLRFVFKSVLLYKNGDIIEENPADNGMIYYTEGKIEKDLGITDDEFDNIIKKIEKEMEMKKID